MRVRNAALLALLLAACGGHGTPSAKPSATTATPRPAARVTLETRLSYPAKDACCVEIPTVHGLGSAAADAAANATLAEIGRRYDAKRDVNLLVESWLAAYDGRYATVEIRGRTSRQPVDETYVFDRATGKRLALAAFFRDLPGARAAMVAYGRKRVPGVVGNSYAMPKAWRDLTVATIPFFVPRPEGLEVELRMPDEEYKVSSVRLAVPWTDLTPYLALPPSPGDADPAYRDGMPPSPHTTDRLKEMHETGLIRVEETQRYDTLDTWVLATREDTGEVVAFYDDGDNLTKATLAQACRRMAPQTKRSFLLRCP